MRFDNYHRRGHRIPGSVYYRVPKSGISPPCKIRLPAIACVLYLHHVCPYIITMNSYLPNNVTELVEQLQLIPHPEGGFFRETYRSGSVPMTSRGLTDTTSATYDLSRSLVHVAAATAAHNLNTTIVPNTNNDQTTDSNDGFVNTTTDNSKFDWLARNALTSIYWVPTIKSPKLLLATNLSDHVHYYQGGGYAFMYLIYSPCTTLVRTEILGPNLMKGHKLQVSVCSGEWKCGHLVSLETALCANEDIGSAIAPSVESHDTNKPDYVIIGEGVGPGFDIHDFSWITEYDINNTNLSSEIKSFLKQHLHVDTTVIANKDKDFDQHYDKNDATDKRMKERA